MKGDSKVIDELNKLLADELTAINQYIVHAEMSKNWGYDRLHEKVERRAVEEMRHAERLIARILFFESYPIVDKLNEMHIGPDVKKQFENDHDAEAEAVKRYNAAIEVAVACHDNGTRDILESILTDEEAHLDWIEAQLDQVKQIGIQAYLAEQIKE